MAKSENEIKIKIDDDLSKSIDDSPESVKTTQLICSLNKEYFATYDEKEIVIWKQNKNSILSFDNEKTKVHDEKVDSIAINSIMINSYEIYKANISDENLLILIFREKKDFEKDSPPVIYDVDNKRVLMNNKYKNCLDVQGEFLEDRNHVNYVTIVENDYKKRLKVHSYSIEKSNYIKLQHSYVTLDNSGYFYLHPEGKLYYGREGIMQQWNIKDGIGTFEYEYYFHCPRSFQVRINKDRSLLAFRDDKFDKKSFSIFSRKFDIVFSQHLEFEIEDFGFCKIEEFKNLDFLIIKVTKDKKNIYYLINPYLKDSLPYEVKTIEHDEQQLLINENLISIVDDKVQIENLLTEEIKHLLLEHIYKSTPTFFLLYINDGIPFINKFKEEKERKKEWEIKIENKTLTLMPPKTIHAGKSIIWEIELVNYNQLKLIAKKSQKIDCEPNYEIIEEDLSYKLEYSAYSFILPNDDLVIVMSASDNNEINFTAVNIYTINTKDEIETLYASFCNEKEIQNFTKFDKVSKDYFVSHLSSLHDPNMIGTITYNAIKRMVLFYLDNISSFILYSSEILHAAIETGTIEIIDAIIDGCIKYYNGNSEISENICILAIVTKSLSYLQDSYPYYVNKFLTYTVLVRAPHNFDIVEINSSHLFGYTLDCHLYKLNILLRGYLLFNDCMDYVNHKYKTYKSDKSDYSRYPKKTTYILYVPLPKFVSYISKESNMTQIEESEENIDAKNDELKKLKTESEFIKMQTTDLYSDWNGEALINFKWQKFGKYYYFGIWILYAIFLLAFTLAATQPNAFISLSNQKILFIISIVLGFIQLLMFEIRLFLRYKWRYLTDPWNYFDLSAYIFPIATSLIWIKNGSIPIWTSAISILFLDFKFLLFFRGIEYFGVYFAIILNVAKKVFSFLLILFFVIFAYAHAFFALLQPLKKFDPSIPDFDQNDPNSPWNLASTYNSISPDGNTVSKNPSLIQLPNANTNLYEFFGTSLLAVYKLMTGDTGSLAPWVFLDNPTLIVLWISFSFCTVIYLLNLFIGLLSNEIQNSNDKSWFLIQRAELIAEIEICCLISQQKKWRSCFYYVQFDKLQMKINEIDSKYKDSPYKPIIHSKLLNLVGKEDDKNEESDQLKSTLETIKTILLKNKDQEINIFKIKNMEMVEYKKKVQN
ncbi:hypothetical protein RclHR1_06420020 [Rhizophagus clarus]|uniref:Ion transport domain-containing protein n=1 Tax=Rhizophagus clarus TaxID=94130 RepID=A0A2Z6SIJ2_9GLOM|nr:hypothetical protein RclHR1_06420020 [Rhizophagus clarus]